MDEIRKSRRLHARALARLVEIVLCEHGAGASVASCLALTDLSACGATLMRTRAGGEGAAREGCALPL
jgi:hypothetical protein